MHQTLYRKYRPQIFDDVCGQDHITSVLKYETENSKTSHAYLFCGSRGTGKTTCAKILAKAINCEHPINGNPCCQCSSCQTIDKGVSVDVIEMDAASNNGVDYIRDIRDNIVYTPAELKKRVYIVDEVHMLSSGAFNALLKTLEEPPEHAVFILATTELQKLPATIVSRCQRFDFHRISLSVIASRLKYIAEQEKITLTEKAAEILAQQAQGGMRDAISLFELCSNSSEVNEDRVISILGLSGYSEISKLTEMILHHEVESLFSFISNLYYSSKDISVFWNELQSFYRDMLVSKYVANPMVYLDITEEDCLLLKRISSQYPAPTIMAHSKLLDEALQSMNNAPQNKRMIAEMTLVKMCDSKLSVSPESLLQRIEALEAQIATGCIAEAKTSFEPNNKAEESQNASVSPITEEKIIDQKKIDTSTTAINQFNTIEDVSELIDYFSKSEPAKVAFLSCCTIKVNAEKTKVILETSNALSKMMLSQTITEKNLRQSFVLSNITSVPPEITYITMQNNTKSPIEEFENM